MSKLSEKIYLIGTYFVTSINLVTDFETIKSVVLFIGAIVLLSLQIRLHVIRIRKEKEKDKDNSKKN